MSNRNPYEDYDAIDPWKGDTEEHEPLVVPDDSGNFSYVEDEYDSMDAEGTDGFGFAVDDTAAHEVPVEPTESFPKTMVRPNYGEPIPVDATADQGVLPLRRNRNRKRSHGAQVADQRVVREDAMREQRRQPAADPRPKRRRRGRRRHRGLVRLLILIVLLVGAYWLVAHPIDEKLAFTPEEQQTLNGTLSLYVPGTPYYLLALGSDAREGDTYSRTDTMLLARIDFLAAKVTLVSIPRDTKVEIEGHGTQKINAAYAFGGAGGAAKAVSKLMNVPINHVAVVHFEELASLVDYLGGVTVNVPVSVYDPEYTGLILDEGTQTLDGQTALLWARTRHGFETGDYQRQEDQRILLSAIMNRTLSLSPREMPGALDRIGELVGTDLRCYNLVPLFLRFKLSNPVVYSCTIPSTTAMIDGVSYVIADEAALAQLMQVVNAGGDPASMSF